nr:hypothetical protein [Paenibacillus oenotherae]
MVQITDASGTEINRYAYDIWGNVTEVHLSACVVL